MIVLERDKYVDVYGMMVILQEEYYLFFKEYNKFVFRLNKKFFFNIKQFFERVVFNDFSDFVRSRMIFMVIDFLGYSCMY